MIVGGGVRECDQRFDLKVVSFDYLKTTDCRFVQLVRKIASGMYLVMKNKRRF